MIASGLNGNNHRWSNATLENILYSSNKYTCDRIMELIPLMVMVMLMMMMLMMVMVMVMVIRMMMMVMMETVIIVDDCGRI